jgi:hypothetical protein
VALQAEEAVVYVYRPFTVVGMAISPRVVINESSAYAVGVGGYFPYFVKSGKVDLSAIYRGVNSISLEAKAGETYFVKVGTKFGGRTSIEEIQSEIATQEIADCTLISEPAKDENASEVVAEKKSQQSVEN